MSGFLKIPDFFKKSVLRKTAEFSVSDTGDPLILTCLILGGSEKMPSSSNICCMYSNALQITLIIAANSMDPTRLLPQAV